MPYFKVDVELRLIVSTCTVVEARSAQEAGQGARTMAEHWEIPASTSPGTTGTISQRLGNGEIIRITRITEKELQGIRPPFTKPEYGPEWHLNDKEGA